MSKLLESSVIRKGLLPVVGAGLLLAVAATGVFADRPFGSRGIVPVAAGNDMPPSSGRYTMAPVDGGFLRMDTDSGVVSLCAKKEAAWRCETVPDDYRALQLENEALKKELSELRRDGPAGPTGKVEKKLELPSDEDIDKAFDKVDKYLRKFRELIEKHQGTDIPGKT